MNNPNTQPKGAKDFADVLVNDLIACVRDFENGRSSWKTVELHAEGVKQALRVPSPHTEDFPGMFEDYEKAALTGLIARIPGQLKLHYEDVAEDAELFAKAQMKRFEARKTREVTP